MCEASLTSRTLEVISSFVLFLTVLYVMPEGGSCLLLRMKTEPSGPWRACYPTSPRTVMTNLTH